MGAYTHLYWDLVWECCTGELVHRQEPGWAARLSLGMSSNKTQVHQCILKSTFAGKTRTNGGVSVPRALSTAGSIAEMICFWSRL